MPVGCAAHLNSGLPNRATHNEVQRLAVLVPPILKA